MSTIRASVAGPHLTFPFLDHIVETELIMKIRKVLFDMDGTLFDTQIFHAQAESELLKQHFDVEITAEELTTHYAGRPTEEVFMEVSGCELRKAQQLTKKKWEKIIPRAEEAKPLCDIPGLFYELKRRKIDFGIGTASPWAWACKLIALHCPSQYFNPFNVVCGDQVAKGKPDPEIWLKLAKGLNGKVPARQCLVVEDGLAGVEGAVAAGMRSALLLPRKHPKAQRIRNVKDVLKLV